MQNRFLIKFFVYFADYHVMFIFPIPWDQRLPNQSYVTSSPPTYSDFYRAAQEFEFEVSRRIKRNRYCKILSFKEGLCKGMKIAS